MPGQPQGIGAEHGDSRRLFRFRTGQVRPLNRESVPKRGQGVFRVRRDSVPGGWEGRGRAEGGLAVDPIEEGGEGELGRLRVIDGSNARGAGWPGEPHGETGWSGACRSRGLRGTGREWQGFAFL